jgi:hypothetical protein
VVAKRTLLLWGLRDPNKVFNFTQLLLIPENSRVVDALVSVPPNFEIQHIYSTANDHLLGPV